MQVTNEFLAWMLVGLIVAQAIVSWSTAKQLRDLQEILNSEAHLPVCGLGEILPNIGNLSAELEAQAAKRQQELGAIDTKLMFIERRLNEIGIMVGTNGNNANRELSGIRREAELIHRLTTDLHQQNYFGPGVVDPRQALQDNVIELSAAAIRTHTVVCGVSEMLTELLSKQGPTQNPTA